MSMPLERADMEALQHFAAGVTIPLLYGDDEFPRPVGTGTLVSVNERLFIVTAKHLFDDCDVNAFALPAGRIKGHPIQLGNATLVRPKNEPDIDVAILELHDQDIRNAIRSGWQSIGLSRFSLPGPNNVFMLCGYPGERSREAGDTLWCTLITAFSERFLGTPPFTKDDVDPDLDLFFHYDDIATNVDGEDQPTPRLPGVSGASVWQYTEPSSTRLWTPERALKVVGIQSSYVKGEWFRAKTSQAVLHAFYKLDAELRDAVIEATGSPNEPEAFKG